MDLKIKVIIAYFLRRNKLNIYVINYFKKNDEKKFEEVRLWIALIFDDFQIYSRPKIEIDNACKAVYEELGLNNNIYLESTNQEKCQILNYYLNKNRKRNIMKY